MRIGLIDVDGHNKKTRWGSAFPNLALMKISAWHKRQGDVVEWAEPCVHYDVLYQSKIFRSSPDVEGAYMADVIKREARAIVLSKYCPTRLTGCNLTIPSIRGLNRVRLMAFSLAVALTSASGVWCRKRRAQSVPIWTWTR